MMSALWEPNCSIRIDRRTDMTKIVGFRSFETRLKATANLFPVPGLKPQWLPQALADCKGKGLPQQAEVAQGVPGRLRPRIFSTFGTTRVVGRHPYAPAAFIPGEIPGTHF
jgi:hypothetical protein